MSERMIELHRAKLLATGTANNSTAGQSISNGSPQQQVLNNRLPQQSVSPQIRQTPQQAAAAALRNEDMQMQRFIQQLQQRNDSRPTSVSAPTVPTPLSRRMLQKQGVGYLDDTVAAVASAAGDRFLATVLQQAVACRDVRLKGAEMAREATRHRKRHIQQYEADANERQRRKLEKEEKREKANLAAIEAAENLKKRGVSPLPSKDGESVASKSKKKKKTDDLSTNGSSRLKHLKDDDEASYDSIDEEEEYYREYYGDNDMNVDEDEEDDDEMLILRDLARPLEAWGYHVTGKEGMDPTTQDSEVEDENDLSDAEQDDQDILTEQAQEYGKDVSSPNQPNKPESTNRAEKKSPDDKKAAIQRYSSSPKSSTPPKLNPTSK